MLKHIHNQKGAMFGLDTRVTIAIMAAMTVIVGYYSIGRIGEAKDGALLKELAGFEEAFIGYQADLGTFPMFTINAGSDGVKDIVALWDVNQVAVGFRPRWNGPYYKYQGYTREHLLYGEFSVTYAQNDATMSACTSASPCYAWLTLTDVPLSTWAKINQAIDEGYGSDPEVSANEQGKVRADSLASSPVVMHYRMLKRPD